MSKTNAKSMFGLDELTVEDIPEGKPCFALVFDFPYQECFSTGSKRLRGYSLPHVPLVLGKDEAYELVIDPDSYLRLDRAYGTKEKWIGKPVLLEVKNKEIQCYPIRACRLWYNWRLKHSLQVWWLEFRAWICYYITKEDLRHPIDSEYDAKDE